MFFPCTNKEQVVIDYDAPLDGWTEPVPKTMRTSTVDSRHNTKTSIGSIMKINGTSPSRVSSYSAHSVRFSEPQYLSKPTMIMCAPNALYYQQMVTSPNAYYLNFFLRRDINVVCWNYRGYGESEKRTFECLSPYKAK